MNPELKRFRSNYPDYPELVLSRRVAAWAGVYVAVVLLLLVVAL